MLDQLISALDEQKGDWYIQLADQRDLADFIEQLRFQSWVNVNNEQRANRIDLEHTRLKRRTAERLFVVLRAAVHGGLLIETKDIQDALGTEETHGALIEVARNARSAEQAWASAIHETEELNA